MTGIQRELFRVALLRVLEANGSRYGLPEAAIGIHARAEGFNATAELVADEVDYLRQKGLVEEAQKTISREVRHWRITEAGRAFLDRGE